MPMGTGWYGRGKQKPTVMMAESFDSLTGEQLTKARPFTAAEIAQGAGKFAPSPNSFAGAAEGGGAVVEDSPGRFQTGGDGSRVAWGRNVGGGRTVRSFGGSAGVGLGGGGGRRSFGGTSWASYAPDDGRRIDAHADLAKTGSDYVREKGGLSGSYGNSFGGLADLYRMNPDLKPKPKPVAGSGGGTGAGLRSVGGSFGGW